MFKADMIAPCGLDCNICAQALSAADPCPGCNGPDENKPEFCARYCGIILCGKRRENGYQYCDECPDYPCADVMEKENRYTTQYPHRESPLENLRMIRPSLWDISVGRFLRTVHFRSISNPVDVNEFCR